MTSPIYRQADSKWGGLKYPSKPYTIARSGCGDCAVNHCVMEQPKYANYTPASTRPYMVQYATRGHGTKWVGITQGLKHWGYEVKEYSSVSKARTELKKGHRLGVILFRAGKKGNIRWTDGGHYVMFQDAWEKNGKLYFKTKDSGGRHHDGVYCWETQMGSLAYHIWVCKRKDPKVQNLKPYPKELPESTIKKGSKGEDVIRWQRFINWVYGDGTKEGRVLAEDGKFGNKTDAYTGCFQVYCDITEDSIVGRNTLLHAKRWGI